MRFLGVDIGGTSCAVSLGEAKREGARVLRRMEERPTADYAPGAMVETLASDAALCLADLTQSGEVVEGIGIVCGSPLDSERGLILSPPNLPGWDEVPIVQKLADATGFPRASVTLCNDADACALAEWFWGAGRGARSMAFLTFGTGFGAGLILDGRLYRGASGSAGELGHVRLDSFGPVGYGKMGSAEGFCSGGGIAQLARTMALAQIQRGLRPSLCPSIEALPHLSARDVGLAADRGDPLAQEILAASGRQLGRALSILIDLLNPERIVIGGVFARCREHLWPFAEAVVGEETLEAARKACSVVPCGLGESVGDLSALAAAFYAHLEGGRT